MAKRALLIGCNYQGTKAELHGCVNDVTRMYKCLVDRFDFAEDDITVMVDTDKRSVQPTGANIKKVLARLIGESNPGDVLVLHYSGHGTQVPAESGDEEDDGLDEAVVPCDLNLLTDDDFRLIFKNLQPGVNFTFISDSCHSGGLIDHEKEQIGPAEGTRGVSSVPSEGKAYGTRSYDGGYGRSEEEEYESRGERHDHHEREHRHHEHGGHGRRDERAERYGQHEYGGYGRQEESSYGYDESEYQHQGRQESHGRVHQVNKSLSIDTLTQMLSQQSGHEVKPGNIRTSLYDLFGDDASPTVKVFVNLIASRLGQGGGDSTEGGGGGSIWSAIGGLAMDFMKTKLNDNNSEYAASAQQITNVSSAVSQSGHAGAKPPPSQRLADDVGVLVSGCQSNETSADANPTGDKAQAYGALSNGIQTVLAETRGPITNGDLVRKVRALLQKQGFKQHPCLYSSDPKVNDPFIC